VTTNVLDLGSVVRFIVILGVYADTVDQWTWTASLVAGVAADLVLTVSLCVLLYRKRTGFRRYTVSL
jgi:hypothetical protein